MFEMTRINKTFGGAQVIFDVSIRAPERSIVGIAGTNGAGKSTIFAIAGGQIAPDSGTITLNGTDVTRMPPQRRARAGLGRTFQVPREFGNLSVLENLLAASPRCHGESLLATFAHWSGVRHEEEEIRLRAHKVIDFLGLGNVRNNAAADLSGGQKKLLGLARILMLEPSIILLDEPFAGVNPVLIEKINSYIRVLNAEEGITFVIIEHHLRALEELCDNLYVMDSGRVIASGNPEMVLSDTKVQEAYMGGIV